MAHRTLLTLGALGAAALADAFLLEPRWLDITHHGVNVEGLPQSLSGFKIAQLSDAHLGRLTGLHQRVAKAIDRFDPDLVVLTGDMIDHKSDPDLLREFCDWLTWPGRTVVAIPGNWEHRADLSIDDLRWLYADQDVHLLVNEHRMVAPQVLVVGTDDGSTGRADLAAAFADLPDSRLRLLLTHAPGILDEYPPQGPQFELTLCGHTHGGQITFAGLAPRLPSGAGAYVAGFYQTPAGRTYVNRGLGTITIPARLFCRPELALFEFR